MKTPYEKHQEKLHKLHTTIAEVQAACSHPPVMVTKIPKRGGEFDNQYYYKCKCNYCGKFWVEDQ